MDSFISFIENISPEGIVSFIIDPNIIGPLLVVKIIFVIISSILIGAIIFLLTATTWFSHRYGQDISEFRSFSSIETKKLSQQWGKILKRLETGKEAEFKIAVIEADSLLEEILKRKGYEGEMMGELLKGIDSNVLPNIEHVWEAHKLRNNIVHDHSYKLRVDEAKRAISIFQESARSLE